MKTPLARLEGRVQKALDAIGNIPSHSASPSYPITPKEIYKIKQALEAEVAKALDELEHGSSSVQFRL